MVATKNKARPPVASAGTPSYASLSNLTAALLNVSVVERAEWSPVHISLARAVYMATLMEEMRVFAVMDRLAQLFMDGVLPLESGSAAKKIAAYQEEAPLRLSPPERRKLYARVLGSAGGGATAKPNTEFNRLFQAFIHDVAHYGRPVASGAVSAADRLAGQTKRVCLSARALARNLSLNAAGVALQVSQLIKQLQEALTLLSDPDVRAIYGAETLWQVVAVASTLELGRAPNVAPLRILAEAGSRILDWLSQNTGRIHDCPGTPLLTPRSVARAARLDKPGAVSDRTMMAACQDWIAATASL